MLLLLQREGMMKANYDGEDEQKQKGYQTKMKEHFDWFWVKEEKNKLKDYSESL